MTLHLRALEYLAVQFSLALMWHPTFQRKVRIGDSCVFSTWAYDVGEEWGISGEVVRIFLRLSDNGRKCEHLLSFP